VQRLKTRISSFALLALVSGCASQQAGIRPLRPLELATAPYQDGSTAAATGSLMYEQGCLLFRADGSPVRLLPIWPTGSVFNGSSVIFHEPGRPDQPILITEHILIKGYARAWPDLPAVPFAPFEHQCGGQPFMVSGVRPAN
jgi:hypothetical protein